VKISSSGRILAGGTPTQGVGGDLIIETDDDWRNRKGSNGQRAHYHTWPDSGRQQKRVQKVTENDNRGTSY